MEIDPSPKPKTESVSQTVSASFFKGGQAFLWGFLIWAVLGSVLVSFFEKEGSSVALRTLVFAVFSLLSLANLYLLARATRALLAWMHPSTQENPLLKTRLLIELGFSALLKFVCLGVILWGVSQYPYSFKLPLVLGLGTLVIVPLSGGWYWLKKATS